MSELHVVIGATGALGSGIVHHLQAEGLPVRALARNLELAQSMLPDDTDIAEVDALDLPALKAACAGATHIYNCLYIGGQLSEITNVMLEAAASTGALLIFPSNTDVYGIPQQLPIPESHPHTATGERASKRIETERTLLGAHERGEVPVIIPRLAALHGAHIRGSFMANIFESALRGKKAFWLGSLEAPHNVLYVPDAAAACVLLATSPDTAGQVWHVNGGEALTGDDLLKRIFRAFGKTPNIGLRTRMTFRMLGTLLPDAKRLLDVMHQFEKPYVLDGAKLAQRFPGFEFTPHDIAIADTVEWFTAEFGSDAAAAKPGDAAERTDATDAAARAE